MNRGAGWFRKWKRDRDPLATPQSPLTQLTDDQLAAAIAEERRRARSRTPQVSTPAP